LQEKDLRQHLDTVPTDFDEELKLLKEWLVNPNVVEDCIEIADRKHEDEEMLEASNEFEIFETNYLCRYAEKGQQEQDIHWKLIKQQMDPMDENIEQPYALLMDEEKLEGSQSEKFVQQRGADANGSTRSEHESQSF